MPAVIAFGCAQLDVSNIAEAQALVERALAIRREAFGDKHTNVAACLNILGKLQSELPARVLVPGQPVLRKFEGEMPVFLDVIYPVTERTHLESAQSPTTPPARGRLLGYVRTGIVADEWYRIMSNRLDLAIDASFTKSAGHKNSVVPAE